MIAWFTRNGVAANLLMFSILGFGLWSTVGRVTYEVFPEGDIDTVSIGVTLRGATPGEVEEAVIIPIEEAIEDLEQIKEITASASEGGGSVNAEIHSGINPRDALDDIKARVDAIVTFPTEAETPTVSLAQRRSSVVKVVITGDLEEAQLRELGDEVKDEILSLQAVSALKDNLPRWLPLDRLPIIGGIINSIQRTEDITSANIIGVRPFEIAIEISEKTLLRYDLTLEEVAQAVRTQSVDLSGGSVRTDGGDILLRTRTRAYVGGEFEKIVVRSNPDGTRVTIGDLGVVNDGFEENEVVARFNGKRAVLVDVNRVGEQNAIVISETVLDYVEAKRAELPPGVEIKAWRDRSTIVNNRLDTLLSSGATSILLVFLVLALFLRISLAGWVVLGIPVAFMGAVICMPWLGASINISSLFGFILVLGIVVDDAIVTGENIYTKLKQGVESNRAAIEGTQEVTLPVTFGILTTIAAFIPLLLIPGRRGAMFEPICFVVIPVLIFSLIESKLILPSHLKHLKSGPTKPAKWNYLVRGQEKVADGMEWFAQKIYQPFLDFCLRNRYPVGAFFVFMLLLTAGWWFSGRIMFMPFPRVASEFISVSLTMPDGTPYEVTEGHISRMEKEAWALRDKYISEDGVYLIDNIFAATGGQGLAGGRGGVSSGASHRGELSIELLAPEDRPDAFKDLVGPRIAGELRGRIGAIPGAEDLNFRAEIGRYGNPVDIQLRGNNELQLAAAAEAVKLKLTEFPGLYDIASNVEDGKQEIRFTVKPEAELLGVTADQLSRQTRGAFFGYEAQRFQRGRDDIRVMVRYPEEERTSLYHLNNLRVRTQDGERIPFLNLAELEYGRSPSRIQRIDRYRTVNIFADADKESTDLESIQESLNEQLPVLLKGFPEVSYTQEGEEREQQDANQALKTGCIFVAFIVYCLLAIPFKSYLQPFMVMSVIPFGIIGAVGGHLIMGEALSFMSLFGMLALSGVVVNDSLVLVDWVNRKRREGIPLHEAVRTGGAARFRAIILTSLTTFAGLMPLLFEKATQAQFLKPMAISLGFGILFATAITLILIPVNYMLLEDFKRAMSAIKRWYLKPFRSESEDAVSPSEA